MKLIAALSLLITTGCSTLMPIAGGATGAALGSALGGPGGAAVGGAAGVAGAQMAFPNDSTPVDHTVALAAAQAGIPAPGTAASTIHETKGLLHEVGWWYLLIFILVPFISKKGRSWFRKFTNIHNSVSQTDIDARDEAQEYRIKKIEEMLDKKD